MRIEEREQHSLLIDTNINRQNTNTHKPRHTQTPNKQHYKNTKRQKILKVYLNKEYDSPRNFTLQNQ